MEKSRAKPHFGIFKRRFNFNGSLKELKEWRNNLRDELCWKDDDLPANNILAARLRRASFPLMKRSDPPEEVKVEQIRNYRKACAEAPRIDKLELEIDESHRHVVHFVHMATCALKAYSNKHVYIIDVPNLYEVI
jgi:hypothetical protein